MTSVAGGGDDHVLIPFNGSAPVTPAPTNFGGLWWNAPTGSESGWALNLAHQGDVIFATWATYDATGKARWLSMTAEHVAGNTYSGTVYQTSGPPYSSAPFDSSRVTLNAVGTGTLTFIDADSGTFAYDVNGVTQTKIIVRGVFASPVPVCTFGALSNLALATNYQDVWSKAPLGSEPGWAINLAQQGGIIFAIWLTYDLDGTPLWLSATLIQANGIAYAGTLYRTTGPPFGAIPFDPAKVTREPVGSASLTFADGNAGTFSYVVNGVAQTKPITRNVFRPPGTVCQ
jgi:lysyl endopeptidase